MTKINGIQSAFQQNNVIKADSIQVATNPNELSESLAGKTNIDGVIDDFQQGTTGNCYFLTQIKNLSRKSWGAKAIKESIEPDGMGGAYITFKGALIDSSFLSKVKPERIHVSVEEMINIREKQKSIPDFSKYDFNNNDDYKKYREECSALCKFSIGDDDVLAMEIAYDKYMRRLGYDMSNGSNSRIYSGDARLATQHDVVRLIMGLDEHLCYTQARGISNQKIICDMFEEIKDNLDDYVLYIAFTKDNQFGLLPHHAYEVVGFGNDHCGNPMITLGNPHDSSEPLELNYYDAIVSVSHMYNWKNPQKRTGVFDFLEFHTNEKISAKDMRELDSLQVLYHNRHEECLRELEEERRQKEIEDKYSVVNEILDIENRDERLEAFKKYFEETDKEAIDLVLENKHLDMLYKICSKESGIFRRKARRNLMAPLIEYAASRAEEKNIDEHKIATHKENCKKQLNKWLFSNKTKLIDAISDIIKLGIRNDEIDE